MASQPMWLLAPIAWRSAEATVWGAPRHKAASNSAKYGTAEVDCPIRFPGQYADNETGLHYDRHRYYDPAAGRYTTADPLGLGPADDPHGYVLNPTGWADPLGLTPCSGIGNGPAPEHAWTTLDDVDAHGVAPPSHNLPKWQGKQRPFDNDGRNETALLPDRFSEGDPITYHEYDIYPFVRQRGRGSERLVNGSDGSAFYTPTHYHDWIQMR